MLIEFTPAEVMELRALVIVHSNNRTADGAWLKLDRAAEAYGLLFATDAVPTCDICGGSEDAGVRLAARGWHLAASQFANDWDGDTGNHYSCEEWAHTRAVQVAVAAGLVSA